MDTRRFIAALITTLAVGTEPVLADPVTHSATQCIGSLYYNFGHISNERTWEEFPRCPITWSDPNTYTSTISVYYQDANTATSLSCRILAIDGSGNPVSGSQVHACSQGGGCASATPSYTGIGVITLTPPVLTDVVAYYVSCTLPGKPTNVASSKLFGYVLNTP